MFCHGTVDVRGSVVIRLRTAMRDIDYTSPPHFGPRLDSVDREKTAAPFSFIGSGCNDDFVRNFGNAIL